MSVGGLLRDCAIELCTVCGASRRLRRDDGRHMPEGNVFQHMPATGRWRLPLSKVALGTLASRIDFETVVFR